METVRKRYITKLFGNAGSSALNFCQQILLTRFLGVEAYGQYSFGLNHITFILAGLELGAGTSFLTFLSQYPAQYKTILKLFVSWSGFIIGLALLYTICVSNNDYFAARLWPQFPPDLMFYALLMALAVHLTTRIISITDAAGIAVKVEIIKFCRSLATLLILLILGLTGLLELHLSYLVIGITWFCGLIPMFLLGNAAMLTRNSTLNSKNAIINNNIKQDMISYTLPLAYSSVVISLINLTERWLLQFVSGSKEQGYFSLGTQIGIVCFLITGAMTPIFHRELAVHWVNKDIERIKELFSVFSRRFLALVAVPSVFVCFFAKDVSFVLGGADFATGWLTVAILSLYPIHQTYGQLSASLLFATGNTKLYMKIAIIGNIMGIITSYFLLAPKTWFVPGLSMGSLGLSLKMILIQYLTTTLLNLVCAKITGIKYKKLLLSDIKIIATLALAAYSVYIIFNNIFDTGNLNKSLVLFAACSIYSLIVGMIFLKFQQYFQVDVGSQLTKTLNWLLAGRKKKKR